MALKQHGSFQGTGNENNPPPFAVQKLAFGPHHWPASGGRGQLCSAVEEEGAGPERENREAHELEELRYRCLTAFRKGEHVCPNVTKGAKHKCWR